MLGWKHVLKASLQGSQVSLPQGGVLYLSEGMLGRLLPIALTAMTLNW